MQSDLVLKMTADLFTTGLLVSLPVLGITMAVGLAISVLQVITQLQEMTLAFVPKLIAAAIAVMAFGPWMLKTLCAFTISLWSQIPLML